MDNEKRLLTCCRFNVRGLGLAVEYYSVDHLGKCPQNLELLVSEEYIGSKGALNCPKTGKPYIYKITDEGTHSEISCPNPEAHKIGRKQYRSIRYVAGKGIIIDPPD